MVNFAYFQASESGELPKLHSEPLVQSALRLEPKNAIFYQKHLKKSTDFEKKKILQNYLSGQSLQVLHKFIVITKSVSFFWHFFLKLFLFFFISLNSSFCQNLFFQISGTKGKRTKSASSLIGQILVRLVIACLVILEKAHFFWEKKMDPKLLVEVVTKEWRDEKLPNEDIIVNPGKISGIFSPFLKFLISLFRNSCFIFTIFCFETWNKK